MTITYSDDKSSVNIQELKLLFQRVADWKMPTDLQDWEDMITYTPLLVAAYSGDRLIGLARVLTDFVRWGEIYDVVVDDSFQGKGDWYGVNEAID
ncbi:GNAT family N-acetyltransferase [Bacillus sp. Marseille-P3800]|uniref:GNAT family N-acetyltransferase n=1 Tax=Bacillus sp. Marseille-P3800 TaxID=2014782 RepID=UPI000C0768D7|nr:GNAT family N-acetyltransferase [Bacillus sp. Marseille-P3800]